MQFFLLLPVQLWLYTKNRLIGYLSSSILLISCVICSFIITYTNDLSIVRFGNPIYVFNLYTLPWTRIAPYQIGIIFGIMYFEWKIRKDNIVIGSGWASNIFEKVKYSPLLRYSLIALGIVIQLFLVIMLQVDLRYRKDDNFTSTYFSKVFNSFFNALSRPLFVTALAIIIISPLTGHNSFIRFILGSKGYVPWARLTYMGYIIHVAIYSFYYFQTRQGVYLSHRYVLWTYLAVCLLTFMLAVPFSICFEMPFQEIEKMIFFPKEATKNQKPFDRMIERNATMVRNINNSESKPYRKLI
jgi:hypothetical protein